MIKIIHEPITLEALSKEAELVFGDMVKAVVDVRLRIMAINGELHSDEEAVLLKNGSQQKDLWGINLYSELYNGEDWLEFDSMINLRPSGGNKTRGVDDPSTREKIIEVVSDLIKKQ